MELLEGGKLWGAINVRTFLLDEGAHFEGELHMQDAAPGAEAILATRPPQGEQIPVTVTKSDEEAK